MDHINKPDSLVFFFAGNVRYTLVKFILTSKMAAAWHPPGLSQSTDLRLDWFIPHRIRFEKWLEFFETELNVSIPFEFRFSHVSKLATPVGVRMNWVDISPKRLSFRSVSVLCKITTAVRATILVFLHHSVASFYFVRVFLCFSWKFLSMISKLFKFNCIFCYLVSMVSSFSSGENPDQPKRKRKQRR